MNAFAIGCMMPNLKYIAMTRACIESIRVAGHNEDIVVVTTDESLRDKLSHEDCIVRCFDVIRYPAVDEYMDRVPWGKFRLSDAQKIHFWRLTEYNKVLAVDADVTLNKRFNGWDIPELSARSGGLAPINTGIMMIKPSDKTVKDLLEVVQSFDPETGWGDYDSFKFNKQEWGWDFQGSFTAQGYVFFYFRDRIRINTFKTLDHWSGKKKYQSQYRRMLSKYIKIL